MHTPLELPQPDDAARAVSDQVTQAVNKAIARAGGWIPFSEYVDLALYAPGLGYYSAGSHKLGGDGDFITAPELTPLFSQCIAGQLAHTLAQLDSPTILELGAGTGQMAVDIMTRLEDLGNLPVEYQILEVSADLRDRQQRTVHEHIPKLQSKFRWLDELPAAGDRILLANEVLDALPFDRFRLSAEVLLEIGVTERAGELQLAEAPAREDVSRFLQGMLTESRISLSDGFVGELRPCMPEWVRSLASTLAQGMLLVADYGLPRKELFHPDRSGANFSCFYQHRIHEEVLFFPGLQDITAWVDFTSLAEAAEHSDLTVAGYTSQANFLIGSQLERELAVCQERFPPAETAAALRTLMLPGEMGERIKFMALTRGVTAPPALQTQSQLDRL